MPTGFPPVATTHTKPAFAGYNFGYINLGKIINMRKKNGIQ